jgi:hypothetical protein
LGRTRSDWHWRGFLRPVWRDPVFWFAVVASAALVAAQVPWLGWRPDDPWWWARFALQGGVTVLIVFSVIGTGAGIARGWERGLAEAEQRHRRRNG